MAAIPTLADWMTPSPHTVGEDAPLSDAIHCLREFHLRHLPVIRGGMLTGVITDRDVKLALSVHPNPADLVVGDVMSDALYTAAPDAPIDRVAESMARHGYGSTIVTDQAGRVVGIFTASDALDALSKTLRAEPKRCGSKGACGGHSHAKQA